MEQLNELSGRFSGRFPSQTSPVSNFQLITSISYSTKISVLCPIPSGPADWHGTKSNHNFETLGISNDGCYGLNNVPQNSYVDILCVDTLVPQNVTIFGNRAFKEVINIKWGHLVDPNLTGILRRFDNIDWRVTICGHHEKQASRKQRERPHKELNLQTPWSWASSLYCEKINVYCLSHPFHGT